MLMCIIDSWNFSTWLYLLLSRQVIKIYEIGTFHKCDISKRVTEISSDRSCCTAFGSYTCGKTKKSWIWMLSAKNFLEQHPQQYRYQKILTKIVKMKLKILIRLLIATVQKLFFQMLLRACAIWVTWSISLIHVDWGIVLVAK